MVTFPFPWQSNIYPISQRSYCTNRPPKNRSTNCRYCKKKTTKKQIENRTTTCRSHITETIPNDKGQLICRFRNWNIKNAIYMDKISQAFTDKFIEIIKIVFSKKKLQSDLMTHFEEK